MITAESQPRGDSETKKKVMNNDGYISLRHHQRDSVQKEQLPDHESRWTQEVRRQELRTDIVPRVEARTAIDLKEALRQRCTS